MISKVSKNARIVEFLSECKRKKYDLDDDDIEHILDLDFEYVREWN